MSIAKKLAELIQAAAKLREDSYDRAGADAATAAAEIERNVQLDNIYAGHVDYSKFYQLTLREACEKACVDADEPLLGEPVYLMLSSWWNDTCDWASSVTGCGIIAAQIHDNVEAMTFKLDNVGPRGAHE